MIVASAIKLADGRVFVGKRHGDCYRNYKLINHEEKPDGTTFKVVQGFINDRLQFLDRSQAYVEAVVCGQCEDKGYPFLLSEDLW
jgi:hypothetical protein